jgi:hypothetical protein
MGGYLQGFAAANAQECSLLNLVSIILRLSQPAEAQIERVAVGARIRMEGIVAQRDVESRKKA